MSAKYHWSIVVMLFLTLSGIGFMTIEFRKQSNGTQKLEREITRLTNVVKSNISEESIYLKSLILKRNLDLELARDIAKYIHKYSTNYNVDPDLILSIISVESSFKPNAVSTADAIGLMQVLSSWKNAWNIEEDLMGIETNIHYGTKIYATYLKLWPDVEIALTAYNRGPGPVESALFKDADPRNGYASKVMKVYERLKQIDNHKRWNK